VPGAAYHPSPQAISTSAVNRTLPAGGLFWTCISKLRIYSPLRTTFPSGFSIHQKNFQLAQAYLPPRPTIVDITRQRSSQFIESALSCVLCPAPRAKAAACRSLLCKQRSIFLRTCGQLTGIRRQGRRIHEQRRRATERSPEAGVHLERRARPQQSSTSPRLTQAIAPGPCPNTELGWCGTAIQT
jgi:hypothetical protein